MRHLETKNNIKSLHWYFRTHIISGHLFSIVVLLL